MRRAWWTAACAASCVFVVTNASALESVTQGAVLDASIGASSVGDDLMVELGGESAGIRSYGDGRWLLQWDVLVALKGGLLANQHPFLFLIGPHALAWTELGRRFVPSSRWSPYVGARAGAEVSVMPHPGLSLAELRTINDVDGIGGVVANGLLRIEAGASLLDAQRSLLLVAFAQEALEAPRVVSPSRTFTEGGLGLRFDLAWSVVASLEGVIGVAPARTSPALGFSDRQTRMGANVAFRKVFKNGMWIGAAGFLSRDTDQVDYASGASYSTSDPASFGFALTLGVPLWRSKR